MTKTARILAFFAAFAATIVFAFGAAATASAKGSGNVVDPDDGGSGGGSSIYTGSCGYWNFWQTVTWPNGAGICWTDGYWYLGGGRYAD